MIWLFLLKGSPDCYIENEIWQQGCKQKEQQEKALAVGESHDRTCGNGEQKLDSGQIEKVEQTGSGQFQCGIWKKEGVKYAIKDLTQTAGRMMGLPSMEMKLVWAGEKSRSVSQILDTHCCTDTLANA